MRKSGRIRTLALAGIVAVSLAGCIDIYEKHGYAPDQIELENVIVGVDTRDTVASTVGPPSTSGLTRDEAWYYVESTSRARGPMAREEVERRVVAISFTPAGTVTNIEEFGLEDGLVVVLNRRVTDGGIQDISFLDQLLGSVGNIDPGKFLGQ
ncbi:outer membrane protein assembly factor BamE [Actibacterium sp.]|uniref:outer membrane protein assembly factor BamE n=1 Tax=Actibacterium sp. TaxID=1872125 RepID=UPI0035683A2D